MCASPWPIRPIDLPGPPRTPSGDPMNTRYAPKPFRCPNSIVLYINLHLRTISELLVMSMISSGTPNNIRSPNHITHITLYRQRTLSVRTLGFENYVDMTETHLRSITNSGTWMLILAPTYSTKTFYRSERITTYVVPFVIGMFLA